MHNLNVLGSYKKFQQQLIQLRILFGNALILCYSLYQELKELSSIATYRNSLKFVIFQKRFSSWLIMIHLRLMRTRNSYTTWLKKLQKLQKIQQLGNNQDWLNSFLQNFKNLHLLIMDQQSTIIQILQKHSEIHPRFIQKLIQPCSCGQPSFYFNPSNYAFLCKLCSRTCKDALFPLESIDLPPEEITKRLTSEFQIEELVKQVNFLVQKKIEALLEVGQKAILKLKGVGKNQSSDLERLLTEMNVQKKKIAESDLKVSFVEAIEKLNQQANKYDLALLNLKKYDLKEAKDIVKKVEQQLCYSKMSMFNAFSQEEKIQGCFDNFINVLSKIKEMPQQFKKKDECDCQVDFAEKITQEAGRILAFKAFDISDQQINTLLQLLNPVGINLSKVKQLYNAKLHGDSASQFHNRCDNVLNTVTLVRANEKLFGGFVEKPWTSEGGVYKPDQAAFLFSVDRKLIFKQNSERKQFAIYCHPLWGPRFGCGDLYLCNNCLNKQCSGANLNNTFECTLQKPVQILVGCKKFKVSNYIVLQIK